MHSVLEWWKFGPSQQEKIEQVKRQRNRYAVRIVRLGGQHREAMDEIGRLLEETRRHREYMLTLATYLENTDGRGHRFDRTVQELRARARGEAH